MSIDMRLRPPFRSYAQTSLFNPEVANVITRGLGFEPAPSARKRSMDLCMQEMDKAGIVMGVVPGRIRGKDDSVSNEDIITLARDFPDRFIGLYGVDADDIDKSLAGIESAVLHGPLRGVNIEPGFAKKPIYINDKSLFPIYDFCSQNGIPVMLLVGGKCGPDMSYGNPNLYLHVATAFPKCQFIISHGGWPFVPPALGPWFWAKNIFIQPDIYFFNCPGMRDYYLAASHYMRDNFLFASGYPLVPMQAGARFYEKRFDSDIAAKLMHENAARIFGL